LNSGFGIGAATDGSGAFTYGLLGTKGFFLAGVEDVSVLALFFFMMVFMDTTATIPTGAMAERWSWKNFCLYGLWVALPYCIFANWVWGGGWLAQTGVNWGLGHGAVDFAGSGVVHAMGGVIGLAGAMVIGPSCADGYRRNLYPGFRLVRIQSRLDLGRHRLANQRRRSQYDASQRHRMLGNDVYSVGLEIETRSHDDVQRHVGRIGRYHRPLCLCR
jgi:ammonia channel protein AmtB